MTYLGYYEKASGRPPLSPPSALWSRIRDFIFPKSVWTLFTFLGLGIASIVLGIIRATTQTSRDMSVFCGFLMAIAMSQFFVLILTIGENDLRRYLILFNLAFDLSLILLAVATVQRLFFRASTLQKSTP